MNINPQCLYLRLCFIETFFNTAYFYDGFRNFYILFLVTVQRFFDPLTSFLQFFVLRPQLDCDFRRRNLRIDKKIDNNNCGKCKI